MDNKSIRDIMPCKCGGKAKGHKITRVQRSLMIVAEDYEIKCPKCGETYSMGDRAKTVSAWNEDMENE